MKKSAFINFMKAPGDILSASSIVMIEADCIHPKFLSIDQLS